MAMAGNLVTHLGVDATRFQRGLQSAAASTRSFAADVTKIVSGIALVDIGKSAIGGVMSLTKHVVTLAADTQTAAVQFEVLTGSATDAAALMGKINQFAAATPFESMEITQAAKQLLAFGGSSKTLISELKVLGELSSGMGIPLTELAELYGKARIQGRLFMEDINQLQGRGINVTEQLAKKFGDVRSAVESGKVNFTDLQVALNAMATSGGDFAGMMQKMSMTFSGQMSTLKDNISAIGRELGQAILPKLTDMVSRANEILQNFNAMPDKVKFLGDVLSAVIDVAINGIIEKWDVMLIALKDNTIQQMKGMAKYFDPVQMAMMPAQAMHDAIAGAQNQPAQQGQTPLQASQARLGELLSKLTTAPAKPPAEAPLIDNAVKPDPSKLKGLGGALLDIWSPVMSTIKTGATAKLGEWKMWGNELGGTMANWLGDTNQPEDKAGPLQFAQAMQKGSAGAMQTILANMMSGKDDPVVKGLEKQTQQLIKGLAPKPANEPQFAPEFA